MHTILCPFCGAENDADNHYCSDCKANLQTLPARYYPKNPGRLAQKSKEQGVGDSAFANWAQDQVKRGLEKTPRKNKRVDADTYFDSIFGTPSDAGKSSAAKTARKPRAAQMSIEDSPMVDNGTYMTKEKAPEDFSVVRPARKWDDPRSNSAEAALDSRFAAAFPAIENPDTKNSEDAPMIIPDEGEIIEEKESPLSEEQLARSASPMKASSPEYENNKSAEYANSDNLISQFMRNFENDGANPVENPQHSGKTSDDDDDDDYSEADYLDDELRDQGYRLQSARPIREKSHSQTRHKRNSDSNHSSPQFMGNFVNDGANPVENPQHSGKTSDDDDDDDYSAADYLDDELRDQGYRLQSARPIREKSHPQTQDDSEEAKGNTLSDAEALDQLLQHQGYRVQQFKPLKGGEGARIVFENESDEHQESTSDHPVQTDAEILNQLLSDEGYHLAGRESETNSENSSTPLEAPMIDPDFDSEAPLAGKTAPEEAPIIIPEAGDNLTEEPSPLSEEQLARSVAPMKTSDFVLTEQDTAVPNDNNLISQFMRDFDQADKDASETPPADDSDIFFSGAKNPDPYIVNDERPQVEVPSDAELLDQLLQNEGYHVHEIRPLQGDPQSHNDVYIEDDSAPDENEGSIVEENKTYKGDQREQAVFFDDDDEDDEDEEIPWGLFESGDMALPQAPDSAGYRTFSRDGVTLSEENNTYQHRMISSLLGKIIRAENIPALTHPDSKRDLNPAVRILFTVLAILGIAFIMLTGITDNLPKGQLQILPKVEALETFISEQDDNPLLILDYTPAYASELDPALKVLSERLGTSIKPLVLNPAAMTVAVHAGAEADYLPGGMVGIRSRIAKNDLPKSIILIGSDILSVRNLAEQLYGLKEPVRFAVIGTTQMTPLLQPYLDSGMVSAAISTPDERAKFTGSATDTQTLRVMYAVWYLCILALLAWLSGTATIFLKSDPNYGPGHHHHKPTPPAPESPEAGEEA